VNPFSRSHGRRLALCLLAAVLIACLAPLFFGAAFAQDEGSITSKVKSYSQQSVQQEVEQIAGRVVSFIRGIATAAAVLFLVWFGLTLFAAGGDSQKKAEAKNRLVYFILALVVVLGAERIVGLIISLIGWGNQ
jgi:type IV secretory pathway VirB2 component (pilin)